MIEYIVYTILTAICAYIVYRVCYGLKAPQYRISKWVRKDGSKEYYVEEYMFFGCWNMNAEFKTRKAAQNYIDRCTVVSDKVVSR